MASTKPFLKIVVAAAFDWGIGKDGKLPWHIPEDLQFFSYLTKRLSSEAEGNATNLKKRNAVIMGRKTFASIPEKYRPLPDRLNIILSSSTIEQLQTSGVIKKIVTNADIRSNSNGNSSDSNSTKECVVVASSLEAAIEMLQTKYRHEVENVFIIGGSQVYKKALEGNLVSHIYLTRINNSIDSFDCDTFMSPIDSTRFSITSVSSTRSFNNIPYDFVLYQRLPLSYSSSESLNNNIAAGDTVINFNRTQESDHITTFDTYLQSKTCVKDEDDEEKRKRFEVVCCPNVKSRSHQEFQYLDMVAEIIRKGTSQNDRTGVGTLALFGCHLRFDLSKSFPLLTTKRVFWKGVVEELLWFIRGDTNGTHLLESGVKIWEANGTREFLDSRRLYHRDVNDLGPIYGFQWRHFGAEYIDMHANYKGKGIDQLAACIESLKTNKYDRRIILSAWNPSDISKMALPPCHLFCQFFVSPPGTSGSNSKERLSCLMYQRSADMGLGVPFNISSYSLLCVMIAQVCDLEPYEFIHVIGNAHVYTNHIEPLREQLSRVPRPFPIVRVNPLIKNIDDFKAEDISLIGYNPYPKIEMQMAV